MESSFLTDVSDQTAEEMIDVIIGSHIVHLSAILHKFCPIDKYKIIFDKMLAQFETVTNVLKKIKEYLDESKDWSKEPQEVVEEYAKAFETTEEKIRKGPNRYTTHYVIAFVLKEVIEDAFVSFLTLKDKKLKFYKKILIFWRRMELFDFYIKMAVIANQEDVANVPLDHPERKELEKIVRYIGLATKEEFETHKIETNTLLHVIQVALAKSSKSLVNLQKISEEELKLIMTPTVWNYTEFMEENAEKGKFYKEIHGKYSAPKLTAKTWKSGFSYMINQDELLSDLELFITFCNKDCVKNFWNVTETNPAKATFSMQKEKIQLSTFVYLHPNVLEDVLKPVRDDLWVKHTDNYGKEEKVIEGKLRLSDKDLMPKDLFWDPVDKERIGILILAPAKIDFMGGFEEYRQKIGAEPFKKPKTKSKRKSQVLTLDEIKSEEKKRGAEKEEEKPKETNQEAKKSKKEGWSWMYRKMSNIKNMFNSPPAQQQEQEASKEQQEPQSDSECSPQKEKQENEKKEEFALGDLNPQNLSQEEIEEEEDEDNEQCQDISNITIENDHDSIIAEQVESIQSEMSKEREEIIRSKHNSPGLPKKEFVFVNSSKDQTKELFKKVIIHIHGGGYIAMSSQYHEKYLRKFANTLKRPLFSIDYRLAPQAKYPENLHDCIRSYFWILTYIEKVIGVQVEDLVLLGDSAGGALTTQLVYWLIENKFKVPNLIVSCYGAFSLKKDEHTGSIIRNMKDHLLSFASMKACHDHYLPKGADFNNDYYISAIMAPDDLIKKLPKFRLYTCLGDPLADDQLRMARKLQKNGVDVVVHAFKHMDHGVLNDEPEQFQPIKIFHALVMKCIEYHFSGKDDELKEAAAKDKIKQTETGEDVQVQEIEEEEQQEVEEKIDIMI